MSGAARIFGIQMGAQRAFVALGKAGASIVVALLRKTILAILPSLIGVSF